VVVLVLLTRRLGCAGVNEELKEAELAGRDDDVGDKVKVGPLSF
jgi:hypothetical protein